MTPEALHHLDKLASRLADATMTVALCADEIRALTRAELNPDRLAGEPHQASGTELNNRRPRPLLDESTLCVFWAGRRLHLGHTKSFWVLTRLARCPHQYVTHLDLIREVWDKEDLPTSTLRSLVRELRRKLRRGGMADLADAIRGHNEHYILDL